MWRTCKGCGLEAKTKADVAKYFASAGKEVNGVKYYRHYCRPCNSGRNYHHKKSAGPRRKRSRRNNDFQVSGPDIIYDYRFARSQCGLSEDQAKIWIFHGYRILRWDTLESWDLEQYNYMPWQPDPVESEVT